MTSLKPAMSNTSSSLHQPVKILASEESLRDIKPKTIPEFFHECCVKYKDIKALAFKKAGEENGVATKGSKALGNRNWTFVSYGDYEKQVEQTALALLYLGVPARTTVAILAVNCPEWFYTQLGAMRINAVAAGIYTTNSPEAVFHVLETSDASVVVVDDSHQLSKVQAIRSRLPQLRAVIQLNGPFNFAEEDRKEGYYRWSDLMTMQFSSKLREDLQLRELEVAPNDCALLIFTSGTTGLPKGVMTSHDALLHSGQLLSKSLPCLSPGQEVLVSYLPLSHMAAQLYDIFLGLVNGATVYFADRNAFKGTLGKTFAEARPTIIMGVPRVYEKIQEQQIELDAKQTSGISKYITKTVREIMLQHHLNQMAGKPTLWAIYWLASKVISRIKVNLGLDRVKICWIGGAPSPEELKRFFLSLDLPLTDVYAMSENSGVGIYNLKRPNLTTSGQVLPGSEVKISETFGKGVGEVLFRSRSNFMGYLKEPEKTKQCLTEDGWIRSGDEGSIDACGNVYLNGRIKELIITAGGVNIPPIHIEDQIKKELPCLSNVVVIGDRRKYLTALMTFKTQMSSTTGYPLEILLTETIEWLKSHGLHYTKLSEMLHIELPDNLKDFNPNSLESKLDDKLQMALQSGITRYNKNALSNVQKVQYFTVLPHDFSIATNELGPTLKMRRNIIHEKYAKIIDKMYRK